MTEGDGALLGSGITWGGQEDKEQRPAEARTKQVPHSPSLTEFRTK